MLPTDPLGSEREQPVVKGIALKPSKKTNVVPVQFLRMVMQAHPPVHESWASRLSNFAFCLLMVWHYGNGSPDKGHPASWVRRLPSLISAQQCTQGIHFSSRPIFEFVMER
jgi:hypothetical protein